MREFHKSLELESHMSDYEKALRIMRTLYDVFRYKSGATDIHVTADRRAIPLGKAEYNCGAFNLPLGEYN